MKTKIQVKAVSNVLLEMDIDGEAYYVKKIIDIIENGCKEEGWRIN